jgi:hypothetical protein
MLAHCRLFFLYLLPSRGGTGNYEKAAAGIAGFRDQNIINKNLKVVEKAGITLLIWMNYIRLCTAKLWGL